MTSNISGPRPEETLPGNEVKIEAVDMKKTSFAGLFSNNRKLTDDNRLMKFTGEDETLKLRTKT
ncbi:UNVERIFIED_CONTAM: hypothetical protein Sradi_6132700 [Sesamum radiatum]|uniref:Uncharacterized protein n=1 Tax=Sesamum radiatum TaxID=300843 RepID=A0AAW2KJZ6_SESRA